MPLFTPPTRQASMDHPFWGRYSVAVGRSVLLRDGHYVTVDSPWLGELEGLLDGETYFLGGRTYSISAEIAELLGQDGHLPYDPPGFGEGGFGEGEFGT